MTTTIDTGNSQFFAKHQDNIMATLAHRIEAAQAAHNTQLVELLEREKQQLGQATTPNRGSLAAKFNAFKQGIVNTLARKSELQVYQYNQGTDYIGTPLIRAQAIVCMQILRQNSVYGLNRTIVADKR